MVNDLTIVALLHIRSWKFAFGRLPHVIRFRRSTLWHIDAGSGRRPPHQNKIKAMTHSLGTGGRPSHFSPPAPGFLALPMMSEPTAELAAPLLRSRGRIHFSSAGLYSL